MGDAPAAGAVSAVVAATVAIAGLAAIGVAGTAGAALGADDLALELARGAGGTGALALSTAGASCREGTRRGRGGSAHGASGGGFG